MLSCTYLLEFFFAAVIPVIKNCLACLEKAFVERAQAKINLIDLAGSERTSKVCLFSAVLQTSCHTEVVVVAVLMIAFWAKCDSDIFRRRPRTSA